MTVGKKTKSVWATGVTVAERRRLGSQVMTPSWLNAKIAEAKDGLCHQDELLLYARPATREAFWKNVKSGPEGCQLYQKLWSKTGYGRFYYAAFAFNAHRVVALWYLGFCGPHMNACHKCKNKNCVAIEHLYWGTTEQNAEDREKDFADRLHYQKRGEESQAAKLTAAQVREVWDAYYLDKQSRCQLGKRYGVNEGTIGAVVQRKTWKELTANWPVPTGERRPRKVTFEQEEYMVEQFLSGLKSKAQLAQELHVTEGLVRYYLGKIGK